jgi:PHS family inorganic phosphate transporter-like MFS transporter
MSDATMNQTDILSRMDDSKITKQHWKVMFISGMGFFTDAYDLFIIGVVISILKDEWHPSPWAVGLVTSTALLAAAFGAIIFGRVADMLGRKRIYGYEVLVLAAGAIASAFSPDIWWLIGFRIILGIGIGGDYPVSATLMSEFSGKKSRGMMVSLVFAMQAAGLIVGPLLAAAFLASGLSKDLVWRLLLAFGAVPALAVFQMRRHMAESPRYLLATGQHDDAHAAAGHVLGEGYGAARDSKAAKKTSFFEGFVALTRRRNLVVRLIGASAAWFLMDFAYYGNTVSSPLVLHAVSPNDNLMTETLTQLAIFAIAAVPGYFVAAAMMDRMGRKTIQIMGFAMMALSFAAIALIPGNRETRLSFFDRLRHQLFLHRIWSERDDLRVSSRALSCCRAHNGPWNRVGDWQARRLRRRFLISDPAERGRSPRRRVDGRCSQRARYFGHRLHATRDQKQEP